MISLNAGGAKSMVCLLDAWDELLPVQIDIFKRSVKRVAHVSSSQLELETKFELNKTRRLCKLHLKPQ